MRQTRRILPVTAGDISGAASALYELGGMTVIHDPSGCNSTYNTHDEIRWYDQKSLIYVSGLTDVDAINGDDDRLIAEVVEAARITRPRFIALCNSPIPFINGTDFEAVAALIAGQTGVPAFYVPTSGMHDYVRGAGLALAKIVEHFVTEPAGRRPRTVNLMGMTPLDFTNAKARASLIAGLEAEGWQVVSCWAMGDDLTALARAGDASVNLIISAAGMRAAKVLGRRFGTPAVIGCPIASHAPAVYRALERAAAGEGASLVTYAARETSSEPAVALLGEPVAMGSLAAALAARSIPARVIAEAEDSRGLLAPGDCLALDEEAVIAAVADAPVVVADPLYRPVVPAAAHFVPLPHLALSGRIFLAQMPDYFAPGFDAVTAAIVAAAGRPLAKS